MSARMSARMIEPPNLARSIACCAAAWAAAACTTAPRQYTLHVNLADASKTVLCTHDTEKDRIPVAAGAAPAGEAEQCPRFGNQPLSSPASLTIKLEQAAAEVKYDLRIAQASREASRADVTALLTRFTSNLTNLIRKSSDGDPADPESTAGKLVEKAATALRDKVPAAAARLTRSTSAKEEEAEEEEEDDDDTRTPVQRLRGYVDEKARALIPAATVRKQAKQISDTNAPTQRLPPPRDLELTGDDLAYLAGLGITADKAADFVIDWCKAESFAPEAKANRYAALRDTQPAAPDIAKLLDLDRKEVVSILVKRDSLGVIQERLEKLNREAADWDAASPAARTFYLMRLGDLLASDLATCATNLGFLAARAPDKQAELEKTAASLDQLSRAAATWSRAYLDAFGPLLRDAAVVVETTIALAEAKLSSTLTLEPGSLEVGVGRTDDQGKREEMATYKVRVKGIERVAILVGPSLSICSWGCFDAVEEVVDQPTAPGGTARRTLQVSKSSLDFTLATALHVTMLSRNDLGIGAILGYPVGAAEQTSTNILVGVGVRHASGVELAAGIHALRARRLKDGYRDPIDLSIDGNQGLTPESVTTNRVEVGLFVLIAFAPSIFNSK